MLIMQLSLFPIQALVCNPFLIFWLQLLLLHKFAIALPQIVKVVFIFVNEFFYGAIKHFQICTFIMQILNSFL